MPLFKLKLCLEKEQAIESEEGVQIKKTVQLKIFSGERNCNEDSWGWLWMATGKVTEDTIVRKAGPCVP